MQEIIEKYKKHLQVNDASYSTVANYIGWIKIFLSKISIENITKDNIENFLFDLKDDYKKSTLNICKSAIRSFLKYLDNNTKVPKGTRIIQEIPKYITLEFLENDLIPVVEWIFPNALKVKTIFIFLFFTGLRVGEVASLKRSNFNLKELKVKYLNHKTKKERIVFYPKDVALLLEQFFCIEEEITSAFNIKISGIQHFFKKLKPHFPEMELSAHTLRHAFATHLRKQGVRIETIQYLMGHSNIKSTMIYAHTDTKAIKEEYLSNVRKKRKK